jgi:hypothetical protein
MTTTMTARPGCVPWQRHWACCTRSRETCELAAAAGRNSHPLALRAVWRGTKAPPSGAARTLIADILSRPAS